MRDVVDFISFDNPVAAQVLHSKILSGVKRLGDFPHSGRKVPELREYLPNFREIVVTPCRVIYKVKNEKVYVLRVIRTERALRLYMLGSDSGERKKVLHEGR